MGKRKRGGNPNYYARRTERARREEHARRVARSPETVAARLLEAIDVDGLAQHLARNLEDAAEKMEQRLEDDRRGRQGRADAAE